MKTKTFTQTKGLRKSAHNIHPKNIVKSNTRGGIRM